MLWINEITSEPKQQHVLTIPGYAQKATLTLEFKPTQNGWFFSLSWGTRAINTERVTAHYNLLRQWRNVLPFGIAVGTVNSQDPMTQTDFSDQTAKLFLLTGDDLDTFEAQLYAS